MNPTDRYRRVRAQSEAFCAPLQIEDHMLQSMPEASPLRWHLAHVTWFFETFLLGPHAQDYVPREPLYRVLFNSYYNGVGDQWPRHERHKLSRPTVAEILSWRRQVDDAVCELLRDPTAEMLRVLEIGLNHEQQHQELMVTDFKHGLMLNPLFPSYSDALPTRAALAPTGEFIGFEGGIVEVGYGGDGFHWDNEQPRHRQFLEPFRLASDLVTNSQFQHFIADGGYRRPELWLSDAWATVNAEGWTTPLYWVGDGSVATLGGRRELDPHAPVAHVSFFEADAFARWAGSRLPTESEWERAASVSSPDPDGTFFDDGAYHPIGAHAPTHNGLRHLLGEVWEWTVSAYHPYPGYRPADGAIGEYNGKFMNDQRVLRGGSCATSRDHIRKTYRNFFPGDKRWQFAGFRLAVEG